MLSRIEGSYVKCMSKIGVILNYNEEIASFIDGVQVSIYQNIDSQWTKIGEVKECFKQTESLSQMREFISQLVNEMKDTKILIGTVITGIPYMLLQQKGFFLCEANEMSNKLFTTVAYDYEKMEYEKTEITEVPLKDYPTSPFKTKDEGVYELDMRKLQEVHPEMSSKSALLPFLKDVKFNRLDVYCSHVMPWFDFGLSARGFTHIVEKLSGEGYKVEIICNK